MEKLGESRDVFGITHGDISTWNTIVCGEELAIIDFMTVGWDYYLFDLFRSLENGLEPTEQEDFVRGYEQVRPIPEHFAEYSAIIRATK